MPTATEQIAVWKRFLHDHREPLARSHIKGDAMSGIAEVARRAGVSKATASRALTGHGYVAPDTRARVEQAAHELGYVASSSASSLVTGRTHTVALVVPRVGRWYFGEIIEKKSNGKYKVQVFSSGQLGGEKDTIEQTRFGVIDMNRVNSAPFNNLVPETVVFGLPFLFRDTEHMHKVVDGEIGDEFGLRLAGSFLEAGLFLQER